MRQVWWSGCALRAIVSYGCSGVDRRRNAIIGVGDQSERLAVDGQLALLNSAASACELDFRFELALLECFRADGCLNLQNSEFAARNLSQATVLMVDDVLYQGHSLARLQAYLIGRGYPSTNIPSVITRNARPTGAPVTAVGSGILRIP